MLWLPILLAGLGVVALVGAWFARDQARRLERRLDDLEIFPK